MVRSWRAPAPFDIEDSLYRTYIEILYKTGSIHAHDQALSDPTENEISEHFDYIISSFMKSTSEVY